MKVFTKEGATNGSTAISADLLPGTVSGPGQFL